MYKGGILVKFVNDKHVAFHQLLVAQSVGTTGNKVIIE